VPLRRIALPPQSGADEPPWGERKQQVARDDRRLSRTHFGPGAPQLESGREGLPLDEPLTRKLAQGSAPITAAFPSGIPLQLSGYNIWCFPLDRHNRREYLKHPRVLIRPLLKEATSKKNRGDSKLR